MYFLSWNVYFPKIKLCEYKSLLNISQSECAKELPIATLSKCQGFHRWAYDPIMLFLASCYSWFPTKNCHGWIPPVYFSCSTRYFSFTVLWLLEVTEFVTVWVIICLITVLLITVDSNPSEDRDRVFLIHNCISRVKQSAWGKVNGQQTQDECLQIVKRVGGIGHLKSTLSFYSSLL